MKIINIIAVSLLACILVSCTSINTSPEPGIVQFGIMSKQPDGELELIEETLTIPLKINDPDFAFGYVYRPCHTNEYSIHDISYLPSSPTSLTGEIKTQPVSNATKGLKTPEYVMKGEHQMEYWFDDGDPTGNYRIDVIVDGKCIRSIRFRVVHDK